MLVTELDLIGETLQSVVHLKNHVTKLMVGIVKASGKKNNNKGGNRGMSECECAAYCSMNVKYS